MTQFDYSDKSIFRNEQGVRKTMSLFYEKVNADKTSVVYTLKDRDHMGYESLYRLYMECDDPTEYLFAVTYLEGWDHWEILQSAPWFKPYIARWRRELEIKHKALALKRIKDLASDPASKDHAQANKFLVNYGWKDVQTNRRGRPSKDEISKAAKELANQSKETEEELARITGLN